MSKLKATFKTLGITAAAGALLGVMKALPDVIPSEAATLVMVVIAYLLPAPWKKKLEEVSKNDA